ncbi:hypothetical protein DMC64_41715 [Amycolatopsis sp. WAC 04197]|uniref:hypothetical protein n=1 Tax=Amycolatopsis sp. WAC 04197 TaxID=2203199 RepID=UPI000F7A7288|nr:hypothetical protein [Amycolatopsis sp. WAC 04197]RSN38588.1 hypothetical protein DMC64_41715 [Amycolatopsis sp. WAC 04197]
MTEPKDLEPGSTFADRLTYLIRMHPDEPGDMEISAKITEQGGQLSRNAVYRLRTGRETNPTLATINSLVKLFGCSSSFLTDFSAKPGTEAAPADADDETQRALELLKEAGVKEVLNRMGQMGADSRKILINMSEQLAALNQKHAPDKPE